MIEAAKKLLDLAKSATPGPWAPFDAGAWGGQGAGLAIGEDPSYWPIFSRPFTEDKGIKNSFYVAACDPTTITALMTRLIALEERNEKLESEIRLTIARADDYGDSYITRPIRDLMRPPEGGCREGS